MPPLYAAVLFDLDNTLWDRDAAIRATGRLLHETYPAVRDATTAEDAAANFAAFDERGLAGRERLMGDERTVVAGRPRTAGLSRCTRQRGEVFTVGSVIPYFT